MPVKHNYKREKIKGKYYTVLRNAKGKVVTKQKWSSNEAIRLKNINKIKTYSQKKFWTSKKSEPLKQKIQEKETILTKLAKIEQRISKYPNVKTLEKEIIDKGVKNFTINIRTHGRIDNNKLIKKYEQILKGKIKNPKEIKNLIIHRQKALKYRLAMKINIYVKNKLSATIDIGGILLEQDVNARNFWEGRYIESNTFGLHAEEFKGVLKNPRSYNFKVLNPQPGQVTKVETGWSFA